MKIINAWICQIDEGMVKPIFGDLTFSNGRIVSIEGTEFSNDYSNDMESSDDIIDAAGRVLTIPNVNYHDHIYSRLAKGLSIKGDMSNFPNILKNLWWKLDSQLDIDMISASADMAAIESIKNGVTYIVDHHSSPNSAEQSLKTIGDRLNNFGLRNILCFETTDRNGDELKEKGIKENIDFFQNHVNENSKSLFGLHASFTLNNDTLEEVSNFKCKSGAGVHVHLCEDYSDVSFSQDRYGKKPVERFVDYNLLDDKSIVAHGIHLDENDLKLLLTDLAEFQIF